MLARRKWERLVTVILTFVRDFISISVSGALLVPDPELSTLTLMIDEALAAHCASDPASSVFGLEFSTMEDRLFSAVCTIFITCVKKHYTLYKLL